MLSVGMVLAFKNEALKSFGTPFGSQISHQTNEINNVGVNPLHDGNRKRFTIGTVAKISNHLQTHHSCKVNIRFFKVFCQVIASHVSCPVTWRFF